MAQPSLVFVLAFLSTGGVESPNALRPTRDMVMNVLDVCAVVDRGTTLLVSRETFHSRWLPGIVFDVVSTAEDGTWRVREIKVRPKEKSDTFIPFRKRHPHGLTCLSWTMEILCIGLRIRN
jgi:hypothetical protein